MHSKCYRPTSFIRIAYFACSLFFLLVTGSPTKAFGSVELKAIFLANAELEARIIGLSTTILNQFMEVLLRAAE